MLLLSHGRLCAHVQQERLWENVLKRPRVTRLEGHFGLKWSHDKERGCVPFTTDTFKRVVEVHYDLNRFPFIIFFLLFWDKI